MFARKNDVHSLTLIDFGLALDYKNVKNIPTQLCGTPGYMAPEFLKYQGMNSQDQDIFSCGVIFFNILTGRHLWKSTNVEALMLENKACIIDYDSRQFQLMTKEELELLKALLDVNPMSRPTAKEALKFDYFLDVPKAAKKSSVQKSYAGSMKNIFESKDSKQFLDFTIKLFTEAMDINQSEKDNISQYSQVPEENPQDLHKINIFPKFKHPSKIKAQFQVFSPKAANQKPLPKLDWFFKVNDGVIEEHKQVKKTFHHHSFDAMHDGREVLEKINFEEGGGFHRSLSTRADPRDMSPRRQISHKVCFQFE